jgi:23S rRNA (adenine2030-N6)-methyltransferase
LFSYRHGFHAGNHADVLKHIVLTHILQYYNQKETPYWFVDLHAGAGLYDLGGDWAQKKGEYLEGIARVWDAKSRPPAVMQYLDIIKELNPDGELRLYPGSPWLALESCRAQDKLRLFEMHPNEADILRQNLDQRASKVPRQTSVFDDDGFAGLKGHIPPPTRRAIVLIDPSYEDKQDYRRVVQTLKDALLRFPTGCYVVWYPQIQRREAQELPRQLEKISGKNWTNVSVSVHKPSSDGLGLHGSGMFVINPPYTFTATMKETLPWLVKTLGQDERANYKLDFLTH